jgi:hypothetical protein
MALANEKQLKLFILISETPAEISEKFHQEMIPSFTKLSLDFSMQVDLSHDGTFSAFGSCIADDRKKDIPEEFMRNSRTLSSFKVQQQFPTSIYCMSKFFTELFGSLCSELS